MKLLVERKLLGGILIALAVLLVVGGTALHDSRRTVSTFRGVDHSHEVLYQLEDVLVSVLNMQTATRGFLLSGEERFLSPFIAAEPELEAGLKNCHRLIAETPRQIAYLHQLEAAVGHATGIMHQLIERRRQVGYQHADQSALLAEGKTAMEVVRQTVREMERQERELLQARSADAQGLASRSFWITVLACLLGVFLITVAGGMAWRDLRRRRIAENELDRFFSLSTDMLCIARGDGYFRRVNPAFTQTLGWTEREMLSRPSFDIIHPDDHEATTREIERQARTNSPILHFENRYRCKDGTWRVLSWRSVLDESGLIYATARDVTQAHSAEIEIRRLNASLQARYNQLETANAELEAFSYSVSHDLRAPLRHTAGFAALLEKHLGAGLDDKGRHYLSVITKATRQMGQLIDDLLSFSRIGRSPLALRPVDFTALVRDVIHAGHFDSGHITWNIAPLPTLSVDQSLLRQVWHNLLTNAVKYSRRSTPPVITISLREETGDLVFAVQDNGVGFDPRYAAKLFNVFSRLHSDAEFEGTGIGLALVRRIISRHGGRTWAEGRPGAGATFYFSLPRQPLSPTPSS